jgi:hypothetical protein
MTEDDMGAPPGLPKDSKPSFEGVWNSPWARADHRLFFGVAKGAPNLIPLEGVEVGSKLDSSDPKLSNGPGVPYTLTPWDAKCGVDGPILVGSLLEEPEENTTAASAPRVGVLGGREVLQGVAGEAGKDW